MKARLFLLVAVALALGACATTPAPGPYASSGRAPPPGCTSAACTQQSNTIAANWYSGA